MTIYLQILYMMGTSLQTIDYHIGKKYGVGIELFADVLIDR